MASGPIAEVWTIAKGSLKGTVYYNTYDSPLAGNVGAVMRLKPGAQPDAFISTTGWPMTGPCYSCHVLSADGSTMIAAEHGYPLGPYASFSYDLRATSGPQPTAMTSNLDEAAFAALYPDGSRFIRNGSPDSTTDIPFPSGAANVTGMRGPRDSGLFDTRNGDRLTASGWDGVIQYAKGRCFPDGYIAFSHHEASGGHSSR